MKPFLTALFLALLLSATGCTPPTGTRVVTAWGLWAAPFGTPIGIGYWHSEHGVNVRGEGSAKPPEVNLMGGGLRP